MSIAQKSLLGLGVAAMMALTSSIQAAESTQNKQKSKEKWDQESKILEERRRATANLAAHTADIAYTEVKDKTNIPITPEVQKLQEVKERANKINNFNASTANFVNVSDSEKYYKIWQGEEKNE